VKNHPKTEQPVVGTGADLGTERTIHSNVLHSVIVVVVIVVLVLHASTLARVLVSFLLLRLFVFSGGSWDNFLSRPVPSLRVGEKKSCIVAVP
jgi:hypothetical protein